mmetsp:Transcript_57846/g.161468  ORF Transcript_57846/g.161468 Transcript_57846/m.161468 type:complete len:313 (+) Transcript_57846:74-1012(+)
MKRPAAAEGAAPPLSSSILTVARKRPALGRIATIGARHRPLVDFLSEEFPDVPRARVARLAAANAGDVRRAYGACFRLVAEGHGSLGKRALQLYAANARNARLLRRVWLRASKSVRIEAREGHGNTLIAQRDVHEGEEIFTEMPLLMWDPSGLDAMLSDMFWMAQPRDQDEIIGLFAGDGRDVSGRGVRTSAQPHVALAEEVRRLADVAWYNGLELSPRGGPLGGPTARLHGVFRLLCRASHSCRPNADFHAVPRADGQVCVSSLAAIRAGEEITISYLPSAGLLRPVAARKQWLSRRFGFTCDCTRCAESQ